MTASKIEARHDTVWSIKLLFLETGFGEINAKSIGFIGPNFDIAKNMRIKTLMQILLGEIIYTSEGWSNRKKSPSNIFTSTNKAES